MRGDAVLFKRVREPAKPVELFRGYSRESEQDLVLFFAITIESFVFSHLYWNAHSESSKKPDPCSSKQAHLI